MSRETDATRVEVAGLVFDYGAREFSLRVNELAISAGEAVACVGTSGSGKSTLLSLIAGILLPSRGRVAVDGVCWSEVSDAERRRRRISGIGLVFQEFELLEYLSVLDNICCLPYFVNPPSACAHWTLTLIARASANSRSASGVAGQARTARPRKLSQGEKTAGRGVSRASSREPELCCSRTSRPGTSTQSVRSACLSS